MATTEPIGFGSVPQRFQKILPSNPNRFHKMISVTVPCNFNRIRTDPRPSPNHHQETKEEEETIIFQPVVSPEVAEWRRTGQRRKTGRPWIFQASIRRNKLDLT
ncbi:hypothetical protein RchiOBHm_Chr1g0359871 [Rosa chinensis]|uniref:Uncharacterized protein n=1 Tax=Rosa chinensis TaxID=74649 RepID=A0A2P6SIJ3_ROSCH|nr:hypothetical protein RchiOBHm_Chr1g0359871 [Rosa chinensis]